jgi:hypothetical protein
MAESGFLLDSSREPLAPAIAWLEGRMEPQATRWKKRLDPLEALHPYQASPVAAGLGLQARVALGEHAEGLDALNLGGRANPSSSEREPYRKIVGEVTSRHEFRLQCPPYGLKRSERGGGDTEDPLGEC